MTDLSQYNKNNALIYTTPEEQVDNKVYSTLNTVIAIKTDMFHSIYPGLYPRKELTNQIGSGMGIEFSHDVKFDEVLGDITEYPDGRKVRKVEGYRCTKTGRRRRPDGTWSTWSEPYEFNWVSRATLDFLADEDKALEETEKAKADPKFKPKYKRKYKTERDKLAHTEELKKFATQRASTGSDLCVIRALSGMQTSFKAADVAKGVIIVSQVIESEYFQAKQAAATIDNIRLGGIKNENSNAAAALLTGQQTDVKEDLEKTEKKTAPKQKKTPEKTEEKPEAEKGLKEQFEELEEEAAVLSEPDYAAYEHSVKTNHYSNEVLEWAILEIMTRIGGLDG